MCYKYCGTNDSRPSVRTVDKPKYMVWTGKQSPKIIEACTRESAARQFLATTQLGVGANVKVMLMGPISVFRVEMSATFKEIQ